MKRTIILFFFLLCPFFLLPCGWDWDTVQMEKQQFPQIHELITGKFYRHSQELYYWRVKNRTDLLKKYPDSLHYYDDLAMAYDKIGDPKKAIEVMNKKESKKPGLYETYANLGLFYMHNNDMKNGVVYVERALKVNPNAHFGREKYQLHLGKYIISRTKNDSLKLPLTSGYKTGFYAYLAKHEFKEKDYRSEEHFKELANAIKGVAGMMTFANYRSPVLLEVLADLLLHTKSHRGAGHLASRAYLKASWETDGEIAKEYYEKAKWGREQQFPGEMHHDNLPGPKKKKGIYVDSIMNRPTHGPAFRMELLETALKYEIQLAEIWFDSVRINEVNWIKQGLNPDSAFAKTYYEQNLKSKAFDVYQTPSSDKIRNEVWLAQQLSKPSNIQNVHGYNILGDSIAKALDKIYTEEFAVTEKKEAKTETKQDVLKEEKPNNIVNMLYILAGMLGLLLVWRVYKLQSK
jgi:tetratricopeptide (TPR) repeat protein